MGFMLVGGIPTPLKNMGSSTGMMTFPTEWKNKKCSKPPTRQVTWSTSLKQKLVAYMGQTGVHQKTCGYNNNKPSPNDINRWHMASWFLF